MSIISELFEHKPYSIKKVGRVWFSTIYSITYEDIELPMYRGFDYLDLKIICGGLNGAWREGYLRNHVYNSSL